MRQHAQKMRLDERGMSLVEILAALVILSIVLVTFFSFFTQSATFTKHNKEKLTAVQIAEEVVAKIREVNTFAKFEKMALDNNFEKKGVGYLNEVSYPNFKVEIQVVRNTDPKNPATGLNKAIIIVNTVTTVGIQNSSFTTEMYFDEVTTP